MGGIKTWLLIIVALGLLALGLFVVASHQVFEQVSEPAAATLAALAPSTTVAAGADHQGFLFGRVTTIGGVTYEGRLRWGGDEEAFWGDYFNGFKYKNPWAAYLDQIPMERRPIEIFGFEVGQREREIDLGRPFMARFGDIGRIDVLGRDVRVTLKSGSVFDLDFFAANDYDDGVRVWDAERGVIDLESHWIRSIEFLPTAWLSAAPDRLHGTVHTRRGDFTGFFQWNREECVGTDELAGHAADGELSVRFDTIRSIARHSDDSSRVTLESGRAIVLSGTREAGHGNRGIYVDDQRYGRVLISWNAFERLDFSAADRGSGGGSPAYGDFPPGRPLTGSVTTRDGRRLVGRLVYDLDESETTETLDAPSQGVDYTILFGLIASIVPPGRSEPGAGHGMVTLHDGEELRLAPTGDLGEGNAGMLIFVDGRQRPEYLPWADVERVDLDRPPASDGTVTAPAWPVQMGE